MKLEDYFKYDAAAKNCIIWSKTPEGKNNNLVGREAGRCVKSGLKKYYYVKVLGVRYNILELIWVYFNEVVPIGNNVRLKNYALKPTIDNLVLVDQEFDFNISKNTESKSCFIKRSKAAEKLGFEYIGRLTSDPDVPEDRLCDYGLYRKLKCNHISKYLHKNLRNLKTDYCKQCVDDYYIALVKSLGMTFIQFSRPNGKGTLYVDVMLPCGHNKSIQTGNLKVGVYRCETCLIEKYKAAASSHGFNYIGHVRGTFHRVQLPCGCITDKHISYIKSGTWSCSKHKMSSLDGVGYIYLHRISYNGYSWLKVGYSYSPEARALCYSELPLLVSPVCSVMFSTGRLALKCEKKFHKHNKHLKLSSFDVKEFMSNGFTECYDVSHENTIIKMFGEIEVM